jgi:hypothetical protein
MNTDNSQSDFANTLTQAAIACQENAQNLDRPTPPSMVNSLLTAEKTAKQEKLDIPFASLLGEWRLCFATSAKKAKHRRGIILGRGYYFPKFAPASIAFTQNAEDPLTGIITNQVRVGGLQLKFTGPCRYQGKRNLLVFDFTELQIYLWGKKIYQTTIRSGKNQEGDFASTTIGKLPFFAFFWATPDGIAARGRGGGLALWIENRGDL